MLEMLNNSLKCTVIERMVGTVKIIGPWNGKDKREVREFENLDSCKEEIVKRGWEVNAAFVKKIVRNKDQRGDKNL